jgi:hypothetical protein
MIKAGDTVTLKSNPKVKMSVVAIYGENVELLWMNESNEIQTKQLDKSLLINVNEVNFPISNEGLLLG